MLKGVIAAFIFCAISVSAAPVHPAEGTEVISRNQILREHHNLMHQILMVLKDNVEMTEDLLDGKISTAQRRKMKKRLLDLNTEVEGMVQKHDQLMKAFEGMIQKREAPPDPEAEAPAVP